MAELIGEKAVQEIHRAAQAYTFIRPGTSLKDTEHDL